MNIDIKDLIVMVKNRHELGQGHNGGEWTNHHGLERCDCDELVEWLNKLDNNNS